jgi:hypothetical protein
MTCKESVWSILSIESSICDIINNTLGGKKYFWFSLSIEILQLLQGEVSHYLCWFRWGVEFWLFSDEVKDDDDERNDHQVGVFNIKHNRDSINYKFRLR